MLQPGLIGKSFDGMFNRFAGGGKPKKIATPPAPDPVPTPEQLNVEATAVGEQARRRQRGRSSLILAGSLGDSQSQPRNSLLGLS